jgi:hypothetical protein
MSLSKPTDDILEAFEAMERNVHFRILVEFFRNELAEQSKANDVAQDDKAMLRGQGRNHVYRFIISHAENARAELRKRSEHNRKE